MFSRTEEVDVDTDEDKGPWPLILMVVGAIMFIVGTIMLLIVCCCCGPAAPAAPTSTPAAPAAKGNVEGDTILAMVENSNAKLLFAAMMRKTLRDHVKSSLWKFEHRKTTPWMVPYPIHDPQWKGPGGKKMPKGKDCDELYFADLDYPQEQRPYNQLQCKDHILTETKIVKTRQGRTETREVPKTKQRAHKSGKWQFNQSVLLRLLAQHSEDLLMATLHQAAAIGDKVARQIQEANDAEEAAMLAKEKADAEAVGMDDVPRLIEKKKAQPPQSLIDGFHLNHKLYKAKLSQEDMNLNKAMLDQKAEQVEKRLKKTGERGALIVTCRLLAIGIASELKDAAKLREEAFQRDQMTHPGSELSTAPDTRGGDDSNPQLGQSRKATAEASLEITRKHEFWEAYETFHPEAGDHTGGVCIELIQGHILLQGIIPADLDPDDVKLIPVWENLGSGHDDQKANYEGADKGSTVSAPELTLQKYPSELCREVMEKLSEPENPLFTIEQLKEYQDKLRAKEEEEAAAERKRLEALGQDAEDAVDDQAKWLEAVSDDETFEFHVATEEVSGIKNEADLMDAVEDEEDREMKNALKGTLDVIGHLAKSVPFGENEPMFGADGKIRWLWLAQKWDAFGDPEFENTFFLPFVLPQSIGVYGDTLNPDQVVSYFSETIDFLATFQVYWQLLNGRIVPDADIEYKDEEGNVVRKPGLIQDSMVYPIPRAESEKPPEERKLPDNHMILRGDHDKNYKYIRTLTGHWHDAFVFADTDTDSKTGRWLTPRDMPALDYIFGTHVTPDYPVMRKPSGQESESATVMGIAWKWTHQIELEYFNKRIDASYLRHMWEFYCIRLLGLKELTERSYRGGTSDASQARAEKVEFDLFKERGDLLSLGMFSLLHKVRVTFTGFGGSAADVGVDTNFGTDDNVQRKALDQLESALMRANGGAYYPHLKKATKELLLDFDLSRTAEELVKCISETGEITCDGDIFGARLDHFMFYWSDPRVPTWRTYMKKMEMMLDVPGRAWQVPENPAGLPSMEEVDASWKAQEDAQAKSESDAEKIYADQMYLEEQNNAAAEAATAKNMEE